MRVFSVFSCATTRIARLFFGAGLAAVFGCTERSQLPSAPQSMVESRAPSAGPVALRTDGAGPVAEADAPVEGPPSNTQRASATLAAATGGVGHLIWQNTQTGERGFWEMQGSTYTGVWVPLARVGTAWDIAASADLTCDGKPDLVWQNLQTGERGIWVMNGTTYTGQWIALGSVNTNWRIAAAADFTADGKADIVWENVQTGERGIWVMNCATYTGQWISFPSVGTAWRIAAAADFANADDKPDLLWQNTTTGERVIWGMNGTTYTGSQYPLTVMAPAWQIAGVADLTCDVRPDIIWQNMQSGERKAWPMAGTTYTGSPAPLGGVGPVWDIAGVLQSSTCPVQVNILAPTPSSTSAASLNIVATVTSASPVTEVLVLTNNTARGYLVYSSARQRWEGTVSLSGYPGSVVLELRARTSTGQVASSRVTFRHDLPPVLTVAAPSDSLVARPSIRVTATCTDDIGACASTRVFTDTILHTNGHNDTTVFATGGPNFDADVSLATFDGKLVTLKIEATDAAGQKAIMFRDVYVEGSQRLTQVAVLPSGSFRDAYGDSLLYVVSTTGTNVEVRLRRIVSGQETVVATLSAPAGPGSVGARVVPGSIVVVLSQPIANPMCTLFRASGTDTFTCGGSFQRLAGDYMAWLQQDFYPTSHSALYRRSLSAKTSVKILDTGVQYDLGPNGDVVYGFVRYRDGTYTQYSSLSGYQAPPRTDGINVMYARTNGTSYDFVLVTASGQELTVASHPNTSYWDDPGDFGVNNGWAAYPRLVSGSPQVWVRSPTGTEMQATFFSSRTKHQALGPAGELLYLGASGGVVRRYYSTVPYPVAPAPLSSSLGSALMRGSKVFIVIGRTVFVGQ